MKLKFESISELLLWLRRNEKLKIRYSSDPGHFLFDLKFSSEDDLIDWLKKHSIIDLIYKFEELTTGKLDAFDSYSYSIFYVILNTDYLESIGSESFSNSDLPDRLLNLKEVGQILGLTKPSIYKLFSTNQLDYFEILSQRKVKQSELIRFIESKRAKK